MQASPNPELFAVEAIKCEWFDQKRGRDVPAKIYYPKAEQEKFPLIIFSHGIGGARESYEYLGRTWASHGYVCVHPQHRGSDVSVIRSQATVLKDLRDAALDLLNSINRPIDVSFAIDQMTTLNHADGVFKNRIDLERIGVGGHSFGAFTALAVAGQIYIRTGTETSFRDARVKAIIAMSTPIQKTDYTKAFAAIQIPCFHMTGTEDVSPIGGTAGEDRRIPFNYIPAANQFFLNFEGGDHMIFSGGNWLRPKKESDARFQNLIKASSTAFWNTTLQHNAKARMWLEIEFKNVLGNDGTFESKP